MRASDQPRPAQARTSRCKAAPQYPHRLSRLRCAQTKTRVSVMGLRPRGLWSLHPLPEDVRASGPPSNMKPDLQWCVVGSRRLSSSRTPDPITLSHAQSPRVTPSHFTGAWSEARCLWRSWGALEVSRGARANGQNGASDIAPSVHRNPRPEPPEGSLAGGYAGGEIVQSSAGDGRRKRCHRDLHWTGPDAQWGLRLCDGRSSGCWRTVAYAL